MIDINQGSSYCCIESRPVPKRNDFTEHHSSIKHTVQALARTEDPAAPETLLPIGDPNRKPGWLELLLEILRALELHPAALEAAQKAIDGFNTRHLQPITTLPIT